MVHSLHSLLVSCQQGDRTKVDSILQSGEVGVNSADEGEISPLHVAAANGYEDVVSLLLSRGANVDQRTGSGWTALHQAAYHGHTNVAEVKLYHYPSTINFIIIPGSNKSWSRVDQT